MSRNQSINRIAPHLSTSFSSVKEVNNTDVPPFSPYFVQKADQDQEEADQKAKQSAKAAAKEIATEDGRPEIFTLVDNPDFSDIFALATGKDDSKLMLIVKKMRKERDVTSMIPISKAQKENQQNADLYLNTNTQLKYPKGEAFTGRM